MDHPTNNLKNNSTTTLSSFLQSSESEFIDTLINLISNASICEIRTYPKPGNVHKGANFPSTTYQDFLDGVYALSDEWKTLANNLIHVEMDEFTPLFAAKTYVKFLNTAVNALNKKQNGGNILLGHLLLLTPLFITTVYLRKKRTDNIREFWSFLESILARSTPDETIELYKAIRMANPGGMGTSEKYDLYSENAFDEIKKDGINLMKVFEYSKEKDTISHELSTAYDFQRKIILPRFRKLLDQYGDQISPVFRRSRKKIFRFDLVNKFPKFNECLIRLFLFILSERPDSLIVRKSGAEKARDVSKRAKKILDNYYYENPDMWFLKIIEFDEFLQKENGALNPGTSADLLASSLFIKFIEIWFSE